MADVGDAVEITFNGPTGADVRVDWIAPDGAYVITSLTVDEDPVGSGLYPAVVYGSSPGTWIAQFTASGTVTAVETYYQNFSDPIGPTPLATVSDYTDLFGALSATRQTLAKALLRRASQLVRDRFPTIDADITAGTVAANSVALAVLNMVARVMRNPAGLRSETTGPFSRTYDHDASSGWLTITDADINLITPGETGATTGKVRVATIRVNAGLAPRRYGGWRGGW